MDGFRQGKAQGVAGECYFAALKYHIPGVYIHSQLLSCQILFWYPWPRWPTSWGNTCKLGRSCRYLLKACYFASFSVRPVVGKKSRMAVLSESQACSLSTWPLSCSKSWKSSSTELEHQEALQRSAFCLALHGTCFSPCKTRSVPLDCTLARSYHSHGKDKGIPFNYIKQWKDLNCNCLFRSSWHIQNKGILAAPIPERNS